MKYSDVGKYGKTRLKKEKRQMWIKNIALVVFGYAIATGVTIALYETNLIDLLRGY